MGKLNNEFERNVFINCPFDNDYFPLLRAILFTLIYLDYRPQISETNNSGSSRISKIKTLILKSKFSIHDISRVELNENKLPRFNMPFECGIDFGAKMCGTKKLREKSFLILEKKQYRYQQFISDISGNDIRAHQNNPENIVKHVRDWIKLNSDKSVSIDWHSEIWGVYNEFLFDYEESAKENKYNPDDLNAITFSDFIELIQEWINGWREREK